MTDFTGAKAALFCDDCVLVYLRDDDPALPWAGLWDLPGGGREGRESGAACALREIAEEFGLTLAPSRLVYARTIPSMTDPAGMAWLFGGWLDKADIAANRFGEEGQFWQMMPVATFLTRPDAIPEMQQRVGMVWATLATGAP